MKFPGLEQTLKDIESEIDSINILHKDWWLASDGSICGACEFVVPALAKRTNAFIDAFAKMVREDNHYAATLFIRPTLEHVLIAVASDEYNGVTTSLPNALWLGIEFNSSSLLQAT